MQVVGHKLIYYFVHMNEFVPFSTSLQGFPANFRESFLTVRVWKGTGAYTGNV